MLDRTEPIRMFRTGVLVALALMTPGTSALAVDGVIEISQTAALAEGSGEGPGFPFVISTGASYRLTSDLDAAGTAVSITADDVTLDLNGFTIRCSACAGGSIGIDAGSQSGTTVRNGTVTGFSDVGVRLGANSRADNMRLVGNSGGGLVVSGTGGIVTSSQAASNGGIGFDLAEGCHANGLSSSFNTGNGIVLDPGCTLAQSTSSNNGQIGISAVGATVSQNAARQNGGNGIAATASTVAGNSAYGNLQDGISATGGSLVVDNTSSTNSGDGFQTQDAASLRSNMATNNGGFGIRITVTFMTPGAFYQSNTAWGNLSGGFTGSGVDQGSNNCTRGTAPSC